MRVPIALSADGVEVLMVTSGRGRGRTEDQRCANSGVNAPKRHRLTLSEVSRPAFGPLDRDAVDSGFTPEARKRQTRTESCGWRQIALKN